MSTRSYPALETEMDAKSELAELRQWQRDHMQVHIADTRAIDTAQASLSKELMALNDVRLRFVDKDWFEKVHATLAERVADLERAQWKLLAATGGAAAFLGWAVGHFWK